MSTWSPNMAKPVFNREPSKWGNGKTRLKHATNTAGQMACPLCHPQKRASCGCWRAPRRDPQEVIGQVPPNLSPISVEKVAINAVMAGCKPEYLPVLLASLEAALEPIFTMHGLLCTTCFSSPIIVVNGPVTKKIGMNWGMNVLGQGNRANATIGRALQLIIRNVGGGIPGDLDRSTFGGPGKYTFCFAEDEYTDPDWQPLSVARGFDKGQNTVTLFQGDGIQGFIDQRSSTPEQLVKSLAMSLLAVGHPKLCEFTNAMLVLSPEHHGIFKDAGWDRKRITEELHAAMVRPGSKSFRVHRVSARGLLLRVKMTW